MRPDRHKRIEELYHAALEREPDERPQFLKDACGDDEPLREEVSSLLMHQGESAFSEFMEEPAAGVGARELNEYGTSVTVGGRLGPYHILSLLGKGGMGEVYRARDSKLGREVAIKVLPPSFALDPDRVHRFEREARLLASLNHPNIATIHGLEEHEGTRFLVLELVEGDTLDDRIQGKPIPVEAALELALQIAEAVEAAHERGIIHRDLKPANVKVTPEGKVKVLDFGLGKAFAGNREDVDLSNSPTLSITATQQGVLLGTAAYMSPEQARGEPVDKRADIWAFGCVLYEMLTGRPTFEGNTVSDLVASVLKSDPDWTKLPKDLHPRIRLLLERCLEKNPKSRYHDIADARVDVEKARSDPTPREVERVHRASNFAWAGAALVVIFAAMAAWT